MPPEMTGKSLRGTSELTLIASIKPGFVAGMLEPVTYATRLRTLLGTLFQFRKIAEEQFCAEHIGPLERLRVLHFVRYAVFDDERRLLLAVSYDHSWESYMRGLVDNAGPLLDAIFCHCDDYAGHSCSEGYAGFTRWVQAHQISADFFYAAEPDLTVDDLRYLKRLSLLSAADKALLDEHRTTLHVGDVDEDAQTAPDALRAFEVLAALERLSHFFPELPGAGRHSDRSHYNETSRALLCHFDPILKKLPLEHKHVSAPLKPLFDFLDRSLAEPDVERARHAGDAPDYEQIQGNIVQPYEDTTHGCLALVQCDDAKAARKLLGWLAPRVSYEQGSAAEIKLNLGLTASGLRTLSLSDLERGAFPREFRDGMEARAGVLGDVEANHPARWRLPCVNWPLSQHEQAANGSPIPLSTVDVVLVLQSREQPAAGRDDRLPVRLQNWLMEVSKHNPGTRILHVEAMRHLRDQAGKIREHFGYVDGLSQPSVTRAQAAGQAQLVIDHDAVALGELVLGYPNERGETQAYATREGRVEKFDLFENGSFLVVRKLKQNVEAFRKLESDNAPAFKASKTTLAGKLMGREKNGSSLIAPGDATNTFDYDADPEGRTCPFHAHIRRANPRRLAPAPGETGQTRQLRPRIARRSLSYGPLGDDAAERGLFFMAYNASIANQYEVIQSWLNGANSTGQLSAQNDLLTGAWRGNAGTYRWLVDGRAVEVVAPSQALVELAWGVYLFAPSKAAIERLSQPRVVPAACAQEAELEQIQQGSRIIAKLAGLGDQEGKREWKRILEDQNPAMHMAARAVWAAIRAQGGALRTPYGLLVGDAAEVRRVLAEDQTFSVREYNERMHNSCGVVQLGIDPTPAPIQRSRPEDLARDQRYEREVSVGTYEHCAREANDFIHKIGEARAFNEARERTQQYLQTLSQAQQGLAKAAGATLTQVQVDLRRLAFGVIGQLADDWFWMPTELLEGFTACSFDIFRPNPESWVQEQTRERGQQIQAQYLAYIRTNPTDKKLAQDLFESRKDLKEHELAQALIGAVLGFTGPTIGSFMSVMNQWIEAQSLSRLQQWWVREGPALLTAQVDPATWPLHTEAIEAMQGAPVPDLLYRTCVRDTSVGLPGASLACSAGERVVVSLASVSAQCPANRELLFGGEYTDKRGLTHACPGQPMALGVMLGIMTALFDQGLLQRQAPLVLSYATKAAP